MPCNAIAAAALCLLAGCALTRSHDTPPAVHMPAAWQSADTATPARNEGKRMPWWRAFDDPTLDALITKALRVNNDVAVAAIRMRRARLQAGLADTNLWPTPSASVTSAKSHYFSNSDTFGLIPSTTNTSGIYVTVSYEVDLWGKLSAQRDAAATDWRAAQADWRAARMSLAATTATLYWQLGYLNRAVADADADVRYARRVRDIADARHRAGAASGLDAAQAEQNLAAREAAATQLRQQRTEARRALAILFDGPPEREQPEPSDLPDSPLPAIAPGLPASVLSRRPDVHAAELRVRGALAQTDATRLSYYPSLTLTGAYNTTSQSLTNFLSNPVGTLAATLALPFVQLNTARLNTRISRTQYDEAVVNFRKTLYTALQETENALSARTRLAEQHAALARSAMQAGTAERLAGIRYREGATALQPWLDAQKTYRDARLAMLKNRLDQLDNAATLNKALGSSIGGGEGGNGNDSNAQSAAAAAPAR